MKIGQLTWLTMAYQIPIPASARLVAGLERVSTMAAYALFVRGWENERNNMGLPVSPNHRYLLGSGPCQLVEQLMIQWHLLNNGETKMLKDYPKKDQAYHAAIHLAKEEIKLGFAISYLTGHDNERGRYVEVMTDQGWNPVSWWQEIEPDYYMGCE